MYMPKFFSKCIAFYKYTYVDKNMITSDALVFEVWFLEDSRSGSNFLSIDILQDTL